MEWQLALLLILGGLIFMMLTGLPLAFCFILVNLVAAFFFWGGGVGVEQLVIRMVGSLTIFALLPVPLFILMGEVMFHSGIAPRFEPITGSPQAIASRREMQKPSVKEGNKKTVA